MVHHYFNASISADKLRAAGFEYGEELEEWANEETGESIAKETFLNFIVERIHESGGIISIEGTRPRLC